jgi:hypothetical protein
MDIAIMKPELIEKARYSGCDKGEIVSFSRTMRTYFDVILLLLWTLMRHKLLRIENPKSLHSQGKSQLLP